jgi:hypothetical protein
VYAHASRGIGGFLNESSTVVEKCKNQSVGRNTVQRTQKTAVEGYFNVCKEF